MNSCDTVGVFDSLTLLQVALLEEDLRTEPSDHLWFAKPYSLPTCCDDGLDNSDEAGYYPAATNY